MINLRFALVLSLAAACYRQQAVSSGAEMTTQTRHAAAAPPTLRLGDAARPTHYSLKLRIVPAEDTFAGSVDIDLQLRETLSTLWLNAKDLKVQRASLQSAGTVAEARAIEGGKDFIGFTVEDAIAPGPARLRVEFTGNISRVDSRGLFKQREGDGWYVISQFESHYARLAFPCFDEPSFKVPWQLTLEVPKDDLAFSNTPVVSERDGTAGFKVIQFADTKPLPSYLVALGVGPFDVVDAGRAGKNGTPVRIITPKGKAADAQYAAEVSPIILELLERYFGIPYPYEKLDVLSIPMPTNFGAMENAGLVTASQTAFLAQPHQRSLQFKRGYAGLAAHEFAHMWFGDLVTTAWWDDIWLNEAFATWMTNKIIDQWKPEWSHHTQAVTARSGAMGVDSLVTARRIRQPIESEHDIVNAFDGITYQKGASVLKMFEHWIGEATFQRGVRQYLQRHANANANASDFLAAISAEAGKDIAPAFSTFLDQAGAPLVTAALRCERGAKPKLILEQQRYLPTGSVGSAEQTWQVPVCVRFGVGKAQGRQCTLLSGKTGELELTSAARCPDWVLPNEEEVGYYRVLYRGDMLSQLLKGGGKQLTLPERVGVLGDVAALARTGKVLYGDVLKLIPPLANDPNREMVLAAAGIVGGLRENLVPESLRPSYAAFIRKIFGPRARKLGWTAKPSDNEVTRLLRPALLLLVAEEGEDPILREQATKLATRWLDDRRSLDAEIVDSVVGVAASHGNRELFERFHTEARQAMDRRERRRLVGALGAFRDPEIARSALAIVLTDEFDPREAITIMWRQSGNFQTRALAYDFVKSNFEALVQRLPRDSGASLPNTGAGFCDEEHRADVEAFFKDRSTKFAGGPRDLARTAEGISLCTALRRTQGPSISAFFTKAQQQPAMSRMGTN